MNLILMKGLIKKGYSLKKSWYKERRNMSPWKSKEQAFTSPYTLDMSWKFSLRIGWKFVTSKAKII